MPPDYRCGLYSINSVSTQTVILRPFKFQLMQRLYRYRYHNPAVIICFPCHEAPLLINPSGPQMYECSHHIDSAPHLTSARPCLPGLRPPPAAPPGATALRRNRPGGGWSPPQPHTQARRHARVGCATSADPPWRGSPAGGRGPGSQAQGNTCGAASNKKHRKTQAVGEGKRHNTIPASLFGGNSVPIQQ